MDFNISAQRLGLDLDEYLELIQLFLETGKNDLNGLGDAVSANDIQTIVERSHSLKGASGNLGINEIYEIARDIEARARNNSFEGINESVMQIKENFKEIVNLLEEHK